MRHIASTLESRRFLLPALLVTIAVAGYAATRTDVRRDRVTSCGVPVARVMQSRAALHTMRQLPSDLPRECRDYLVELDRVMRCEQLPAESRYALDDAITTSVQAWRDLPPHAMRQLAQACRSGLDALARARDSLCGSEHRDQDRGRHRDREQQAQQ